MELDYEQGLNMARWMKKNDMKIRVAIGKTMAEQHGVVALKFTDNGKKAAIEILDEPFDDNVRVFPG